MLVCFECLDFAEDWAVTGNEFLDCLCSSLPVISYSDKTVGFLSLGSLGNLNKTSHSTHPIYWRVLLS